MGEHPIATAEREVREETGLAVTVTGYIGVWVDEYATEPGRGDAETINVAYYRAIRANEDEGSFDADEVSELGWFHWDRPRISLRRARWRRCSRRRDGCSPRPPESRRSRIALADPRYEPGAHPPAFTASRETSSGPPRRHWLPAGSSV